MRPTDSWAALTTDSWQLYLIIEITKIVTANAMDGVITTIEDGPVSTIVIAMIQKSIISFERTSINIISDKY